MSALIVDIAEAVAALVNAGTYDDELDAVFTFLPKDNLKNLGAQTWVDVFPLDQDISNASRTLSYYDVVIPIAIRKRCADDAEVSAFLALVQQVIDQVAGAALPGLESTVQFVSIKNEPVIAYDDLEQNRVGTSVIHVTYRAGRTKGSV